MREELHHGLVASNLLVTVCYETELMHTHVHRLRHLKKTTLKVSPAALTNLGQIVEKSEARISKLHGNVSVARRGKQWRDKRLCWQ